MSIADKLQTVAENVPKVYMAGASDFGLKGKGQGELVHFDKVHPIEHKVEVGLSSKNLFNEDKANITKTEDYFKSNVSYWQSPCSTIPVESGATYTCSCEYYTPNVTNFNTMLAYSISIEKTYTSAAKALAMRLKTQSSTDGYYRATDIFTVPDGIEEVYFIADNEGAGTFFKKFQIEKSDTPTTYAPFVADFSDCKVKANGKNLLNINRERGKPLTVDASWNITSGLEFEFDKYYLAYIRTNKYYHNFGTATIENNTISLTVNNAWFGIGFPIKTLPNITYTISAELDTDKTFPAVTYYDYSGNFITETNANLFKTLTFTTPSNCDFVVISFTNKNANETTIISNVQLEAGTATEYEPYTETEYTANADGTVEGVKSISPVMNLSTDKAGAIIDAECFLDPQAVITDLTNTVITLGGEV